MQVEKIECYRACPFSRHDKRFTEMWCGFEGGVEELLEELPTTWWFAYLNCPRLALVC